MMTLEQKINFLRAANREELAKEILQDTITTRWENYCYEISPVDRKIKADLYLEAKLLYVSIWGED